MKQDHDEIPWWWMKYQLLQIKLLVKISFNTNNTDNSPQIPRQRKEILGDKVSLPLANVYATTKTRTGLISYDIRHRLPLIFSVKNESSKPFQTTVVQPWSTHYMWSSANHVYARLTQVKITSRSLSITKITSELTFMSALHGNKLPKEITTHSRVHTTAESGDKPGLLSVSWKRSRDRYTTHGGGVCERSIAYPLNFI